LEVGSKGFEAQLKRMLTNAVSDIEEEKWKAEKGVKDKRVDA